MTQYAGRKHRRPEPHRKQEEKHQRSGPQKLSKIQQESESSSYVAFKAQHNRGVTDFLPSDSFRSCPNRSHIPRLCFCDYYGEEEPGKPEAGGEPLLAACHLWREALQLSPPRALAPTLVRCLVLTSCLWVEGIHGRIGGEWAPGVTGVGEHCILCCFSRS